MTYQKDRDESANNCTELICLVPRKESITALSSLLSDHDTEIFCGCEIKQVFKAGSDFGKQWEEKRVGALLDSIHKICGEIPGAATLQAMEIRDLIKAYEEGK